MKIDKIRVLGTQMESYVTEFYTRGLKTYQLSDSTSGSKFKDSVEILLCLGIIKPKVSDYFETKSQFLTEKFEFTGVGKEEIASSFIRVLNSKRIFNGQEQTLYNICLVNQAYNFDSKSYDPEAINEVEKIIDGKFEESAAKYWLCDILSEPNTLLEMRKFVGILDKYSNKKMDDQYFSFMRQQKSRKYTSKYKYEGNISSSVYNINALITDIGRREYHIPIYQRNYVWDIVSIDRLMADICENEYINLNNVTFHATKNSNQNIYNIIDGQQRITTLFIMLVALHRYLNNYFSIYDEKKIHNSRELLEINNYIAKYLFEDDERIKTNFVRIEGNSDYKAFQRLLNNEEADIELRNTNIYKNYIRVYENLDEMSIDKLTIFAYRFINNVVFILTVDMESDEFTLFENLNTTSIPLSTIDLIKSYLLSLIDDELEDKEETFQELFDRKITKILETKNSTKKTDIDNFMRAYIRLHAKKLDNKKSLLEQYKEIYNIDKGSLPFNKVTNILENLSEKLSLYQYITRRVYTKPVDIIDDLYIEDFIDILGDREVYTPLILFFIEKFQEGSLTSNEVRLLLFELEKFEIIFKVCSYRGQSLTSVMDNVLNKLSNHKQIDIKLFKQILSEERIIKNTLSIDKKTFKATFNEFSFSEQISKIVLIRMTNYLKNNKKIELNKNDKVRRLEKPSLEHMMPMDPELWIKADVVSEEEHQGLINKIGNHFLLEQSLNSKVKNSLFDKKIKEISTHTHMDDDLTYHQNASGVGFEIKTLKKYDASIIKARQKYLTELAVEIWKG